VNFQASASLDQTYALCKICAAYFLLHAGFLHGLFFKIENGGKMFLQTSVDFEQSA
jgi:hypothetical protein